VKEKGRSIEAANKCTTPGNMLLFARRCGMGSGDASSGMRLARIEMRLTGDDDPVFPEVTLFNAHPQRK